MKRDPNCRLCPLHKTAEYVCLLGKGPEPCDVMIIGEAPGHREDDSGTPFVGRSGQLLDEMLSIAGISRKKVYVTNAVHCRPPDNRTPSKREVNACKKWLDYEIAMVKPKFILTLGNIPLQAVTGLKGIKKQRGRAIEQDGRIILPTYHPAFALRDDKQRPQIIADLKRFKEIVDFGGIPYERSINFTVVNTWDRVGRMIDALDGVVSCDIETTCLYPWDKKADIVTLGFGTAIGEFNIPMHHKESTWDETDLKKIVDRVAEKLQDCILVFQAGKFDLLWLKVHYKVEWQNDFDTMLAHYLLDENSLHDLEFLAKRFFAAPRWDIPLEEKQGNAPFIKIAKYHAQDLYWTRKLYFKLKADLAVDPQVKRVFDKLLMPCSNEFVRIEHRGCTIDLDKMDDAEAYLKKEMAIAEERLNKWGKINWGSPKQVGNLLYDKLKIKCPQKTPKGANSTSESTLNQIDHPAVADLIKFRGHKQQLSFFIEGWKPFLHRGRIHPSFKLHGTATGRLSCEHPNFQQVPRDQRIRSLVIAPEGWEFIELDLSQIELRIVAELSGEPSMMQAFYNNIDIHWFTAMREIERGAGLKNLVISTASTASQLKKPPSYSEAIQILLEVGPDVASEIDSEWKEYRKKAKSINFGYVFGMWWKKFKIYARDNYDVHLTDQQAKDSRIAFFQMYGLEAWHDRQRSFAQRNGYVRSLPGRKRRLPAAMQRQDTPERAEALRQAINSPVQSFASDLNLMTLLQLRKEFKPEVFQPIMTVHDSIGSEVKRHHVIPFVTRALEIMKGPELLSVFGIKLKVPICGEAKIGPWGKGVSLEKWRKGL